MIDSLLAKGIVPDFLVRLGIRNLLKQRISEITFKNQNDKKKYLEEFISVMKSSPIAEKADKANEQHYEVPSDFYQYVLGEKLKYSCCYYEVEETLNEAEGKMLEITTQRANLQDGQKILELGCGWGSLTLFMAEKFPHSSIVGISNSKEQKKFIDAKASSMNLLNVKVITQDMNDFQPFDRFDRIVSVEMFEHIRNYKELLSRLKNSLFDNGRIFIHIFVHKETPYFFEPKDTSDWMSKYFFSGGMMPSNKLLYHFDDVFQVEDHWEVNGIHYSKTAEDWLKNMDSHKGKIMKLFKRHYGNEAQKWFHYWRVFFMACSELWKYKGGKEWFVSHYLLKK